MLTRSPLFLGKTFKSLDSRKKYLFQLCRSNRILACLLTSCSDLEPTEWKQQPVNLLPGNM